MALAGPLCIIARNVTINILFAAVQRKALGAALRQTFALSEVMKYEIRNAKCNRSVECSYWINGNDEL
jgi:hypothetical protein